MSTRNGLQGLQVLVVGIEDFTSRDVVRALAADGASVTAAANDERALARLRRDLEIYRTAVNTAVIDLSSGSEMRSVGNSLRMLGRLPHLIVCCCKAADCPMTLASAILQPSFLLHVQPAAATGPGRALAAFRTPALPALFERAERRGLSKTHAKPRRVQIGGHLFMLHPWQAAAPHPAPRTRRPSNRSTSGARRRSPLLHSAAGSLHPTPSDLVHQETP